MTSSETFKDFVIKQMEAAGYELLSNGEFQTTSDAVILSFWVPGYNEWVLNVISSGRELKMNENAIEALAERKMKNAIRFFESNEPVVAAAAKARAHTRTERQVELNGKMVTMVTETWPYKVIHLDKAARITS